MPKPPSEDTEVTPLPENDRRQRRRFSAADKERILKEADACTERGQLGELLRREGIYSSQLATWRSQREHEGQAGLAPKAPGPKPNKDAKDREIECLKKQVARLEKERYIQSSIIEIQKKAHEILGIALPRADEAEIEDSAPWSRNDPKESP